MLDIPRAVARRVKRIVRGPTPTIREREIPPQETNFNSGGGVGYAEYARLYKEAACLVELPIIKQKAGFTPSSSILDYGCGWGRLAYAMGKFLSDDGAYYGYEPHPTGLNFLKSAYADRRNFFFDGSPLNHAEDYVSKVHGAQGGETIAALDVDLTKLVKAPVDVQWSSSVFTHMWVDPIVHILSSMKKVVKPSGICINTWLMIDEHAAFVMRCGLADRVLPFEINRAFTYSKENPLVNTAYELVTIKEIYERAGHEILEIIPGWWAGNAPKTAYHQDIIISRAR